ncbi:MAG: hypothetical protein RLZZ227_2123 [Pseudomonadota bacterium]
MPELEFLRSVGGVPFTPSAVAVLPRSVVEVEEPFPLLAPEFALAVLVLPEFPRSVVVELAPALPLLLAELPRSVLAELLMLALPLSIVASPRALPVVAVDKLPLVLGLSETPGFPPLMLLVASSAVLRENSAGFTSASGLLAATLAVSRLSPLALARLPAVPRVAMVAVGDRSPRPGAALLVAPSAAKAGGGSCEFPDGALVALAGGPAAVAESVWVAAVAASSSPARVARFSCARTGGASTSPSGALPARVAVKS